MSDEKVGFKKVLNWSEVLALAFSAMIGWGWVVLSGDWIGKGGTMGAILGFVIGGVLVVFVGLTYAELTVAMPKCGGELVFSMRAIGKSGSFICTWMIILGYVGVVAFEACAFPTVLQYIIPGFMDGETLYTIAGWEVKAVWVAAGVGLSIVITIVNYIGIKPAAILNTVLTVVIAAVGIALVAGSAVNGDMQTAEPFFNISTGSALKGVFAVAVMTPFMFVGFDVLPQAAEEINIQVKKVGGILILSIIMAVVFYTAIIFAVSRVMTLAELEASSLATADAMAKAFGMDAMAKVLIIGGLSGIVTSWNAFFVGGSRAIYAMAEGKMLPNFLGKLLLGGGHYLGIAAACAVYGNAAVKVQIAVAFFVVQVHTLGALADKVVALVGFHHILFYQSPYFIGAFLNVFKLHSFLRSYYLAVRVLIG
ncbi:hypothetical protein FACS189447_04760 [Spirochaetia bacterium]|nr:hypothetical protein FACS189447_04760 [Spirochaetia bacterium]